MPVITIRGLLGSGAPEIGKQIAHRLHINYVDREIVAKVATQLHRHEQDIIEKEKQRIGFWGHIVETLEHSYVFEGSGLHIWEMPLDDAQYFQSLQSVIRELAAGWPIVIFGRGSQFILKDDPEAFHILVIAPLDIRIKRVMQGLKSDEKTAKHLIAQLDSSNRKFVKRYFHAELEDSGHYDLVIKTEQISFVTAASLAIAALSQESTSALLQNN